MALVGKPCPVISESGDPGRSAYHSRRPPVPPPPARTAAAAACRVLTARPSPPFRSAAGLTFIKGQPVSIPCPGAPMVIEFWATWCERCGPGSLPSVAQRSATAVCCTAAGLIPQPLGAACAVKCVCRLASVEVGVPANWLFQQREECQPAAPAISGSCPSVQSRGMQVRPLPGGLPPPVAAGPEAPQQGTGGGGSQHGGRQPPDPRLCAAAGGWVLAVKGCLPALGRLKPPHMHAVCKGRRARGLCCCTCAPVHLCGLLSKGSCLGS